MADRPSSSCHQPLAERRRARRRVRMLLWLVAAVLMADALIGDRGLATIIRARATRQELAAAVASLWRQNAALQEKAQRLREDPRAIEALARRELGLAKRGELLFIVKDVDEVKGSGVGR